MCFRRLEGEQARYYWYFWYYLEVRHKEGTQGRTVQSSLFKVFMEVTVRDHDI